MTAAGHFCILRDNRGVRCRQGDNDGMNLTENANFEKRMVSRYDELKWLYNELYGDEWAFALFISMLHRCYEEREDVLRQLDASREAEPGWFTGADKLGMMMYAGGFGRDLRGVRSHLDYVQACGVNYLHLMPLLESPAGRSDGGFAVADFTRVQPELGTMGDLSDLTRECHDRGMGVCLDFVMNHTSEEHEWAKRARAGEKEYQDRYFVYDDWEIPNRFEETVPQVFPQTAPGNFTWCEEMGKVVMTTFYPYQWDLNYANPAVFNDMMYNMLYLCNRGVDVIRLDAVPYIWKELGTSCRNLPQVHTLVRIMRLATEVVCPGTILLGEVVMEPSQVISYFGTVEKPECHLLYNVTTMATIWHTVATRDVRLMKHQMGQVFTLPREQVFLNYLRCHDDIGWGLDYEFLKQFGIEEAAHKHFLNDYFKGAWPGTDARGELYNDDPALGDARVCGTTASLCGIEAAERDGDAERLDSAIRLDIMLHALLYTQSGIPVLYSGDEIGQYNDYSYHEDPDKREDSRYLHRGSFDWTGSENRNREGTREERIFSALRHLNEIRSSHRAFDIGADVWILETWNDHVLGIGRYCRGEKLLALFNFSDHSEIAWIDEAEPYADLLTDEICEAKAVSLKAHDFAWLVTTFSQQA